MSRVEVTYEMIECDAPDCDRLADEYVAFDWVTIPGDAERHYCPMHHGGLP